MAETNTETIADLAVPGARPVVRTLTVVHGNAQVSGPLRLDGRRLVIGREPGPGGLELDDRRASRKHCELSFSTAFGVYRVRDLGSKNGTRLGGRAIEAEHLPSGSVIRVGDSVLVYSEVADHQSLVGLVPSADESLALARARRLADLVAPTDLSVLIHGPTGAGKEVLSRRIHAASGREGRFVAVNCATFTRELLASELFGHARGAFSGAQSARTGLFVEADGGTLLLDEIGELPIAQQPALLRAIQEQRVRPVGANREVKVDVRVIAATHADLLAMQEEGRFRADLYARLTGMVIDLPGLAGRREEVLPLLRTFLGVDLPIDADAAERLLVHPWAYGIRELQHVARSIQLFAQTADRITIGMLPQAMQAAPTSSMSNASAVALDARRLAELLGECGGNVSHVAERLGETRQKVYRMLKAYGLDAADYRD